MEAIQFVSDSRDADYIFDDDDEANFIQAAFSSGCSWHIVYELAIVHQETRLHFYQVLTILFAFDASHAT